MLVSLYTSRVVLNTLGVLDFGIYNAVGGVVAMFSVITGALTNAISRYITYGIGKGNKENLKLIFSTSVNIQIVLAAIVLISCEIAGVWFLNNKMDIPLDRIDAAHWVLQFSMLTFLVNLISVPYNACIIAHERMSAYAYISIFDALLKLSVAFMLMISYFDSLITYSVMLFVASIGVRFLYGYYCREHFSECKYRLIYDKKLFREIMGFAGWNFLGNTASILNTQGVNLLINVFFGVIANSARGIATQVEAAVCQFVVTFTTAVNPQITKTYAKDDINRMNYLICKGAKFSYFLLLLLVIPLVFEADEILKIWLINVPEGTPLFMRLALIGAMVSILGNTSYTACLATGKIKKYSIVITLVGSLAFWGTWIAYRNGASVEMCYIIYIGVYTLVQIVRLFLMKGLFDFPIMMFIKEVVCRLILPTIASLLVPYLICDNSSPNTLRVLIVCISSVIWTGCSIMLLGLTSSERRTILNQIQLLAKKIRY